MTNQTWLILADKSRAVVYQTDPDLTEGPLRVHELTHEASRTRDHEIASDDRGRRRAGAAGPRGLDKMGGGTAAETSPQEHEFRRFSKDLASWLRTARTRHAYDEAVLVAPPAFLGMLRQDLDDTTLGTIRATLGKQLSGLPQHSVLEEVRDRLP